MEKESDAAKPQTSVFDNGFQEPPVLSLVNLGCSKNLVDSERILGHLADQGFLIAQDPACSELCLVNTCGFIQEARDETASVLKEISQLKEKGHLRTIVALGCMVERVADASELDRFLSHADARLGFKDYPNLGQICGDLIKASRASDHQARGQWAKARRSYAEGPTESAAKKKVPKSYTDFLVAPRLRIGSPHSAYLKISEGCNNPCRFCAIPRMRGLQVSRPMDDIVQEAQALIQGGAREVCLIAQDTTSYGQDLYGEHKLADLLRALSNQIEDPVWFRLMYAYPKHLTEEMLKVLASDPRFCPYIDMPLQHISDPMLSAMARGVTEKQTLDLLDAIERIDPQVAVRTTFIVGYPGETEKDFDHLLAFIESGRFTHAGVFLYSPEPLTPAYKTEDTVPIAEKVLRRDILMAAQQKVSRTRLKSRLKNTYEVLLDGPLPKGSDSPKGARALARSQMEAPEVDGVVFLRGPGTRKLKPGTVLPARVVKTLDYDLIAEVK